MDILINNAGANWIPDRKTVDGYESIFATNHLGMTICISTQCQMFDLCFHALLKPEFFDFLKFQLNPRISPPLPKFFSSYIGPSFNNVSILL